jgi:hypothetical protein
LGSVVQSHDFPHKVIARRRRVTTPRNITLRSPVPIAHIRAHRIAVVIVRLHFAMMLQTPGRILRLIMNDPHLEGTIDGASLPLAFVVCDLAGVFRGACLRTFIATDSAGGAIFGQSVASFCGPGLAV